MVTEQAPLSFGGLLRKLRAEAKLTQEELAEAAGLSPRSVSDLERGINRTAHKDTALLLAGALGLDGPARELFVAAARGKAPAADVLVARQGMVAGAFAASATRSLPRDIASFTGRSAELTQLLSANDSLTAGGGVVAIHAIESDYTIVRPRVIYSLTDHVDTQVGYLFIAGRAESVGGQFRRNGQGWVEVEYKL